MEKFDLLLAVLRDMQKADILRHFILFPSCCGGSSLTTDFKPIMKRIWNNGIFHYQPQIHF